MTDFSHILVGVITICFCTVIWKAVAVMGAHFGESRRASERERHDLLSLVERLGERIQAQPEEKLTLADLHRQERMSAVLSKASMERKEPEPSNGQSENPDLFTVEGPYQ